MEKPQLLGFVIALIGAIVGIVGGMLLFFLTYEPYWIAELDPVNLGEQGYRVILVEKDPLQHKV